MNPKKTVYILLVNMLIFSFVVSFIRGITLPATIIYLFITYLIVAIALVLHDPILRFLTVKRTFFTQWITNTLLVFAAIYALELLMPEVTVQGFNVDAKTFSFITLNSFVLSKVATMGLFAIVTGLVSSLLSILKD